MFKATAPWTDDELDACKRLYFSDEVSAKRAAAELNKRFHAGLNIRTRNSVLGLAHRRGWSRSRGTRRSVREAQGSYEPKTHRIISPRVPEYRTRKHKEPIVQQRQEVAKVAHVEPSSDIPSDGAAPVTFFDLRPNHCRFPLSGEGLDILYCGAGKAEGTSYCLAHCKVVFAPQRIREAKQWHE